jgi:hypothetical protein
MNGKVYPPAHDRHRPGALVIVDQWLAARQASVSAGTAHLLLVGKLFNDSCMRHFMPRLAAKTRHRRAFTPTASTTRPPSSQVHRAALQKSDVMRVVAEPHGGRAG